MPHETNPNTEKFSTAECLRLFDNIPESRQQKLDWHINGAGLTIEGQRNCVEMASEDPEKIQRLTELLKLLSERHPYSEAIEAEIIPEKIKELLALTKYG